jgi:hypothetical protein
MQVNNRAEGKVKFLPPKTPRYTIVESDGAHDIYDARKKAVLGESVNSPARFVSPDLHSRQYQGWLSDLRDKAFEMNLNTLRSE